MRNTQRKVLFHLSVDECTLSDAIRQSAEWFDSTASIPHVVHTPNAEALLLSISDSSYGALFSDADLILPDGDGLLLAAKLMHTPLKCKKVAGIDFFAQILSVCANTGKRVFLLGGKPGVAQNAAKRLCEMHPNLQICGTHDGYFSKQGAESDAVIEKINRSQADFLAVCLGMPAQEIWMRENRAKLHVQIMGGFGGALDVFAGNVKRAPQWIRRLHGEWAWRLLRQPARFSRVWKFPYLLFYCARNRVQPSRQNPVYPS